MTADQLAVFLYENSLEFVPSIFPFSRTIEGEGREGSVEAFLQCVQLLFTKLQFTKEGLKSAQEVAKSTMNKLSKDSDRSYETVFLRANTQNSTILSLMNTNDLDKVDFEEAKVFFRQSFLNPADFVCVITGSFELEELIVLIEKYLGPIQKPSSDFKWKTSFSVPFPPGVTTFQFPLPNQSSALTHLTFPLQIKLTDQNIHQIAFMCQVIEARLRRVITAKMHLSYGVDVSYEFPLYPLLNNPWVSIRYRCEPQLVGPLKSLIIAELGHLQSQGVQAEEIARIKTLEANSQEFWLKDNFYWLSMLTNYELWGWDLAKIANQISFQNLSVESVNQLLKQAISLHNYSIVTAIPESSKKSS